MALLVRQLGVHWSLVLPKWSYVPHWRLKDKTDDPLVTEWKSYFDLKSLEKFVSVIEFNDFIEQSNESKPTIDVLIGLDHFEDTFESNNWSERHSIDDCIQTKYYAKIDEKVIHLFETNEEIDFKRLVCLKIEGFISTLKQIINGNFSEEKTIYISNAEVIVNNEFGTKDYWSVRRSMRFNNTLILIANSFRQQFLNSNDVSDKTLIDNDWTSMMRSHGEAIGGQYLAVHLRRSDFAKWRSKDVPNIDCALKQIEWALKKYIKTNYVFIASDANESEWNQIINILNERKIQLFRFKSDKLTDGQRAIVEQWIAVHAMQFIGTYDSTFSFRIQEEREILGFSPNTTFNALCPKCGQTLRLCKQESQWEIVY